MGTGFWKSTPAAGYNAALLCERLGSEYVTSVDIDPELVDLARERLAANGYTLTLATADGAGGYPPGAPYHRIIATCSVPAIPPSWLAQTGQPGPDRTYQLTFGGPTARLGPGVNRVGAVDPARDARPGHSSG